MLKEATRNNKPVEGDIIEAPTKVCVPVLVKSCTRGGTVASIHLHVCPRNGCIGHCMLHTKLSIGVHDPRRASARSGVGPCAAHLPILAPSNCVSAVPWVSPRSVCESPRAVGFGVLLACTNENRSDWAIPIGLLENNTSTSISASVNVVSVGILCM